jgi:hypothetical protein
MSDLRTITGGCHCGLVRFEATLDLASAIACNCSICLKKGLLFAFVPRDRFALRAGQEDLTVYQFGPKVISHAFCSTCGVETFADGTAPDGTPMVGINVRCIDDIDLAAIELKPFDGRSV